MKELESLKSIAESQLIELHNSLRDEREQKHIYKQQLDHRIQQVKEKKFLLLFFSLVILKTTNVHLFQGITSKLVQSSYDVERS